MRLILLPKLDLTDTQLRLIDERVSAPEHLDDAGPLTAWRRIAAHNQLSTLFAFFHKKIGVPVGIVEASGTPNIVPAWWIDSLFRGRGYGSELVDLLARHLKTIGITGVGRIPIITTQGVYDDASIAMATRFKGHFEG